MVQAALNKLGSTAVASYTAAGKIEQIAGQAYVAIGTTMATYCAQNRGAAVLTGLKRGSGAQHVWDLYIQLLREH